MKIAIHQPHYFPWLGYLDKMSKVDMFIIMDDVQLTDRSPMLRNKFVDVKGNVVTLSVDLHKKHYREKKTKEIMLNYENNWIGKHMKFFQFNYAKHVYFAEVWPELETLFSSSYETLLALDNSTISLLRKLFDINTPIIMQSDLPYDKEASGSYLILSICKCVNASQYLSGNGARSYMDVDAFSAENIRVDFQKFTYPVYAQNNSAGSFVPNLSALDILFNCGIEQSRTIFRNNMQFE